jgi:hypothetical protein
MSPRLAAIKVAAKIGPAHTADLQFGCLDDQSVKGAATLSVSDYDARKNGN